MATTYKVLGQAALTQNTTSNVYTVPAATQAVISTIVICNRGAANTVYRLAVQPAGAALANQHFISYDTVLPQNDTIALTLGITLGNTDVISANTEASNDNVCITIFGSEIT
jgi:hypothetical protein